MSPVQGSVATFAGYVCRNPVIRRLSIPIFGVLRELVLLEKPANKNRKLKFPTKPLTKNRPNDSPSKNAVYKPKCYFHAKARSSIGTDLCLSWLSWAKNGDKHKAMCPHVPIFACEAPSPQG